MTTAPARLLPVRPVTGGKGGSSLPFVEHYPMKFHSHQLRDTFAVTQLLSGTSMQDLSKMLAHKSVKITEKYYSPWVPERQAALERRMAEALVQMGVSVSL